MLPPERETADAVEQQPVVEAFEPAPVPEPQIQPEPEAANDFTGAPAWEESPERKPVSERRAPSSDPTTGFTFDFNKIDTPGAPGPFAARPAAPAPAPAQPVDRTPRPEPDGEAPAFPVPEFGVPIGRGPAARRSDEEVDGGVQHANFREIMDENFQHPERSADEPVTTPVGRDGKPHLVALESEQTAAEQAAPRIVHPNQVEKPLIPLDPDLTVEYDVLGAETSAEETAQLAWSEQFLRRGDTGEQPAAQTESEPEPEPMRAPEVAPEPRLLDPVRPVPNLVLAKFPEPAEQVEPAGHSSESDRTHRIGPATIEFRPVVEADPDDPDDFCSGV
jgi:hypothetical protein